MFWQKCTWGVLAGLLALPALQALHPGDPAADLEADFVHGTPLSVTGSSSDTKRKVLVFFRTRSEQSSGLYAFLQNLRGRYADTEFVMLTPDGKEEAKKFFDLYSDTSMVQGAADSGMQSSKAYLSGTPMYPYAFLIGTDGIILWEGEAADLGEALSAAADRKLEPSRQRDIALALEELRSRFRSGEERMAQYAADKIFKLDPANSEAVRIRLYMLQSAGRSRDAWNFLEERRAAAPGCAKLYLQQLLLALQIPGYQEQPAKIGESYLWNVKPNLASDSVLAQELMTRCPFDAEALRTAGRLLGRCMDLLARENKADVYGDTADVYSTAALYSYRLGKVERAVELQKRATAILEKKTSEPARLDFSLRRTKYYEAVRTLLAPDKK